MYKNLENGKVEKSAENSFMTKKKNLKFSEMDPKLKSVKTKGMDDPGLSMIMQKTFQIDSFDMKDLQTSSQNDQNGTLFIGDGKKSIFDSRNALDKTQ